MPMMRMLLHPGVLPAEAWKAWTFDPLVVPGLVVAMLIYARGLHNLWSHAGVGRGVREWQAWCFAGGIAVLVIALVSPVHAIGGALFSVHMSQHVLLMGIAAPFLVLGAPLAVVTWALPRSGRRTASRILNVPPLKRVLRAVSTPAAAWLLHAVAIWIWHLPALYGAAVTSELAHAAQHSSFMATALLFWWSLRDRASSGIAVLCLFTTAVHSSLLGALLAFSPGVTYPSYVATAPAWGVTALEDQQIGGMIMWVPAGLVYFAAALLLLARLLRASERRVVRIAAAALAALLVAGCEYSWDEGYLERAAELERGRVATQRYGCGACHEISGIAGAIGRVGPPLTGFADRVYIAGYLPNEPDNLVGWIMNPSAFRNPTGMPVLGVTEREARDIAAYLYSLR
jgi:putative membrane protein